MEESSNRAYVNFIKLNQKELSSKIALLVSKNSNIVVWKKSPRQYEARAVHVEQQSGKTYLKLQTHNFYLQVLNEQLYLSFSLQEIKYFLRGAVIRQDADNSELVLELEEYGFRAEKRKRERLVTYPIYEVYAYVKYNKAPASNVVFFNQKDQATNDFFSQIDRMQKQKMRLVSESIELEDDEDVVGFRVEDLSSTGMSFFATLKEKNKIFDQIENSFFEITLNFEKKAFTLKNAKVVYAIDYINPKFSNVPMFKIGINFNQDEELKEVVENHVGRVVELEDFQKEFEEFIKNGQ